MIESYKFDMRLYVLCPSVQPLKIYVYTDGLVRLCTFKYKTPEGNNLRKSKMHLTNCENNSPSCTLPPPYTPCSFDDARKLSRSLTQQEVQKFPG